MELKMQIDWFYRYKCGVGRFFNIYSFSNENINACLPLFPLKGSDFFTVGSSFDQVINASLQEPKSITLFDICPLTDMFRHLKVAALLVLERNEFVEFLCKGRGIFADFGFMSIDTYERIKPTLKELNYDYYQLWDEFFATRSFLERCALFRGDVTDKKNVMCCNNYLLNDENYKRARKTVLNVPVSIICGDIRETGIVGKYDVIWLSNLIKYFSEEDSAVLLKNAIWALNSGGKILYSYNLDEPMFDVHKRELEELSGVKIFEETLPVSPAGDRGFLLTYTDKGRFGA